VCEIRLNPNVLTTAPKREKREKATRNERRIKLKGEIRIVESDFRVHERERRIPATPAVEIILGVY